MTTPTIECMDIIDPQACAMLQAFYSRSPMPIRERLREMHAEWMLEPLDVLGNHPQLTKLKEKLAQYYIGYGHRSVGELGEVVIFIENVSIVAAKAVQHSPLYGGQECSTRYLDFSKQPSLAGTQEFVQPWREFYVQALPVMVEEIGRRHYEDRSHPDFNKTCKAAAFDVLRGFLPVAFLTSLAWKTDFAHCHDHLQRMAIHPLPEVRELAAQIFKTVRARYPYAFPEELQPSGQVSWWNCPTYAPHNYETYSHCLSVHTINPTYTVIDYEAPLDYGSWRDIARHRNGRMYWAQPRNGTPTHRELVDSWYFQQLPDELQQGAERVQGAEQIHKLTWHHTKDVYSSLLLSPVPTRFIWDTQQAEYVSRLRTGKTVHQTLRLFMQEFSSRLHEHVLDTGSSLLQCAHAANIDEDNWTLRRGSQDIIKRDAA